MNVRECIWLEQKVWHEMRGVWTAVARTTRYASRCLRLAILFILSLFVTACGQPEIQGLKLNAPPWQDGETSIYRITEDEDSFVGTMQIDLDALGDDAWTMRREIVVPGGTEIVAVKASESGLRPRHSLLVRTETDGQETSEATYENGEANIALKSKFDVVSYERMNVPTDIRDQRTLPILARLMPLTNGYAVRVNSFLPIAGLLERVTYHVKGEEQIETPAGTFDTWFVELDFGDSDREIRAWIAKDAPYQLVRYEDERAQGAFELAEYSPSR